MKSPPPSAEQLRASRRQALRALRTLVLLTILLIVAVGAWHERSRSRSWQQPLYAALYPLAADDSPVTRAYVASLDTAAFTDIDRFMANQAHRYGCGLEAPMKTRLKPSLSRPPPARDQGAGMLGTLWWSLKLRAYAWRQTRNGNEPEDIRVFVLYHDPTGTRTLPHSSGLEKGLIGVVHGFARNDMDGSNNVVIAHEILHTLGATDKYDPATDGPRFPDGYGDPGQVPLYPQRKAELMGGRRMIDAHHWEQPESLADVVIGPQSAGEIGWSTHAP